MNKWTRLALVVALGIISFIILPWWLAAFVVITTGAMLTIDWIRPGELGPILGMAWARFKDWSRGKLARYLGLAGVTAGGAYGLYRLGHYLITRSDAWSFVGLALAALYVLASLRRIKPDTYRAFVFLGKRLFWIGEGIHFVPFGICWLHGSVKYQKQNTDGRFTATTKEEKGNLELEAQFSVLWMPDIDDLFTFFRMARKDIEDELRDAVQEILLAIAGNRPASDFIEKVEYIQLLIECHLSLPREKVPCPHSLAEALDYCHTHKAEIQKLLVDNKQKSEVEKRLGISVEMFSLSDTDFTPAVKAAMEAARKAEEERKAAEIKAEADRRVAEINAEAECKALEIRESGKAKLRKELIEVGVPAAEAVEASEVGFGQAEKKINSFRGLGDLAPVVRALGDVLKK